MHVIADRYRDWVAAAHMYDCGMHNARQDVLDCLSWAALPGWQGMALLQEIVACEP
jgi:hypothetical protein